MRNNKLIVKVSPIFKPQPYQVGYCRWVQAGQVSSLQIIFIGLIIIISWILSHINLYYVGLYVEALFKCIPVNPYSLPV